MLLLESAFNWFNDEVEHPTYVEQNSTKDCSLQDLSKSCKTLKAITY